MASRALRRAAHRFADRTSARLADIPASRKVWATVTTVTPGGAADGLAALVKVTWRGVEVTVNGYPDSYTPAVNHRVLCSLVDSQLVIDGRYIGQP